METRDKIIISGGNGLIGKHLCKILTEKGYLVAILSRSSNTSGAIPHHYWNYEKHEIDLRAIENVRYFIHLAGANIGDKRWTPERKQEIVDSRVKSARFIFDTLKENNVKLKAFISASAIGYYGSFTSDRIFEESDPAGNDFLAQVSRLWEETTILFEEYGTRTVTIRTGVVLSNQGGPLTKMALPVKYGLGAALGKGNQYLPWIHLDDLCNIYVKAIEDEDMQGVYNAVAPEHRTNKEFTKTLAKVMQMPMWLPNIPSSLLKLAFGEMANILLKGSRVSSSKIINAGFSFKFPDLDQALKDILK